MEETPSNICADSVLLPDPNQPQKLVPEYSVERSHYLGALQRVSQSRLSTRRVFQQATP